MRLSTTSWFNLVICFFPSSFESGDPQMDLERFYDRY